LKRNNRLPLSKWLVLERGQGGEVPVPLPVFPRVPKNQNTQANHREENGEELGVGAPGAHQSPKTLQNQEVI
jgi:hypothetical protein